MGIDAREEISMLERRNEHDHDDLVHSQRANHQPQQPRKEVPHGRSAEDAAYAAS